MARKYQHTMELLPQIKEMLAQGMTQKQVEDALGLSGYRPVHALLKRERKKEIQGISKQRGRKQAAEDGKRIIAGFSAVHRREVKATVKYAVIYRHRQEYPVLVMCRLFGVSRSGYYDYCKRIGRPEPDTELAEVLRGSRSGAGRPTATEECGCGWRSKGSIIILKLYCG